MEEKVYAAFLVQEWFLSQEKSDPFLSERPEKTPLVCRVTAVPPAAARGNYVKNMCSSTASIISTQ